MRKIVSFLALLLAVSFLCSCSTLVLQLPDGLEGPQIETVEQVTEPTEDGFLFFEISDFKDGEFYPTGYDGMYERLVNRAYRALLDFEILRENDEDVSKYTDIEKALAAFLEGKVPTYMYAYMRGPRIELPLYMGFAEPLSKLIPLDEERFMAEKELVDLFIAVRAFNSKNRLETANDNYKRYFEFYKIRALLTPRDFKVINESYDSELGQIILEFYVNEGWDILVYYGDEVFSGYKPYSGGAFQDGIIYVDRGELFKLEAPFPEKIFFAPINEHGIIGRHNVYYLKTAPN